MRNFVTSILCFAYNSCKSSSFVFHNRYQQVTNIQYESFVKPILATNHFSKYFSNLLAHSESCSEIFLESTDAFGIVYNANYVTLYQRALEENLINKQADSLSFVVMERFENMKFAKAAELGDKLCVVNCFKEVSYINDDDNTKGGIRIVCDQTCTRVSDGEIINSVTSYARLINVDGKYDGVFDDIDASASKNEQISAIKNKKGNSKSKVELGEPIRVFTDETQMIGLDSNGNVKYGIGLLSSLRYFERSRTLFYGGPKQLQRLAAENGIAVVVAKIDNLILHHPQHNGIPVNVSTGDTVIVHNNVNARGKSLITFHHKLYLTVEDSGKESTETCDESLLIAECSVILACLNATSGRAASFPDLTRARS